MAQAADLLSGEELGISLREMRDQDVLFSRQRLTRL
jgi:hypothetical protein